MVWILIPKEKKDEIEWNKDLLEKFKNCEDLVEVSNHFIQEGGFLMDRREDLDGVGSYLEIERIKEVIDFPIDVIDERIAELEEELEEYPNTKNKKEVIDWIVKTKVKKELEDLRKDIEEGLLEQYRFFEGCIFVHCYKREECLKKVKEKFPGYMIYYD
jgi:hypothetical protein